MGRGLRYCGGLVDGAVVGDDYFHLPAMGDLDLLECLKSFGERRSPVAGANDDGAIHIHKWAD